MGGRGEFAYKFSLTWKFIFSSVAVTFAGASVGFATESCSCTWAFGILTLKGQRKQRVQWRLSWPQKQWLRGREHRWGSPSHRLQCLVGESSYHWFQSSRQRNPVCRLSGPEPGDSHCAPWGVDQTLSYSCLLTVPPPLCLPRFPNMQFALKFYTRIFSGTLHVPSAPLLKWHLF